MNKEEIKIIEKEINNLNVASQCALASGKERKDWLDTANAMKKMLEENEQLKDNWNKLKEYCQLNIDKPNIKFMLETMQELENGDSNE